MPEKLNTEDPKLERRFVQITQRATGDEENPIIEGDAAVFEIETKIGSWFRETIRPGAFKRVLSEEPDVIAAYNHNWDIVLGRTTAGTLSLRETKTGLHYETNINPKDNDAMGVYQRVKRGDVNQASFAFTVRTEEWQEPPSDSEELPLRTIIEVGELYDVGPVAFGAYPQASASARSMAETLQQEEETPPEPDQAASGGAEDQAKVKVHANARRRSLRLLGVKKD